MASAPVEDGQEQVDEQITHFDQDLALRLVPGDRLFCGEPDGPADVAGVDRRGGILVDVAFLAVLLVEHVEQSFPRHEQVIVDQVAVGHDFLRRRSHAEGGKVQAHHHRLARLQGCFVYADLVAAAQALGHAGVAGVPLLVGCTLVELVGAERYVGGFVGEFL